MLTGEENTTMDNQFEKLSNWLDKLFENELLDMAGVIFGKLRTKLPSPLNSTILLAAAQTLDKLDEIEKYCLVHFPDRFVTEPKVIIEPETPFKSTGQIPFTNRVDELWQLLSYKSPPYVLIDAPPGYGKSEFLRELEKQFAAKNWVVAKVAVHETNTLQDVINFLQQDLKIEALEEDENLPPTLYFAGALKRKWQSLVQLAPLSAPPVKSGIVLIFDFQGRPSTVVLKDIFEQLIPDCKESLHTLNYFNEKQSVFRVILAGRYLAARPEVKQITSIPLTIQRLSPFDYDVIQATVREYLLDHNEVSIIQIAAHLMHLTGGHPGLIAQILKMYAQKGVEPDKFMRLFGETIWENQVRPVVEEVRNGIDDTNGLREVLDYLSIFRYSDPSVLRDLINVRHLNQFRDEYTLADELTLTYLLSRKGRFLQDAIARRLLVIRMRYERPDEFPALCEAARSLCAKRLKEPNVQKPEVWIIEYLFQSLQKHANEINGQENRQALYRQIMEHDILEILNLFINGQKIASNSLPEEKDVLDDVLSQDWEFQFTVNYFMREKEYDNKPFKDLQQKIMNFF